MAPKEIDKWSRLVARPACEISCTITGCALGTHVMIRFVWLLRNAKFDLRSICSLYWIKQCRTDGTYLPAQGYRNSPWRQLWSQQMLLRQTKAHNTTPPPQTSEYQSKVASSFASLVLASRSLAARWAVCNSPPYRIPFWTHRRKLCPSGSILLCR